MLKQWGRVWAIGFVLWTVLAFLSAAGAIGYYGKYRTCQKPWAMPASNCRISRRRPFSASCSIFWQTWNRGSKLRSASRSRRTEKLCA